jgi:PhnB protein
MADETRPTAISRTTIAPWLSVRDSARAVEFYKEAFAAEEVFRLEDEGGSVVAQLSVNGADFWLGDESPEHANYSPETLGGGTVRIVRTVSDPDAVVARAIAAGATEVWPVGDYGNDWRIGRVVDPYGHHWEIGKPLAGRG